MADAKIRFQVEGMESIHSGLEQLKRDAESLSSVFETHNATITSQLKEQLQLLKERNTLLNPTVPPPTTPGQTGSKGSDDEKGLLLRDLTQRIDSLITVLTNQGIRLTDETISRLGGGMGPQPNSGEGGGLFGNRFSRGLTRQFAMGMLTSGIDNVYNAAVSGIWSPTEAARNIALRKTVGSGVQALGGTLMMIPNPYTMVAGALLYGGSAIFNYNSEERARALQLFESSSQQRARMSSLYGYNPSVWAGKMGSQFGGAGLGFPLAEALGRISDYTVARGGPLSYPTGNFLLALERAFSLSSGDISSLERSYRTSPMNQDDLGWKSVASLYENLRGAGVSEGRLRVSMSDYLKTLVTLNQAQVDRLGKIDQSMATQNIAFIGQLASVAPTQIEKIGQISSTLDSQINPTNPYQSALLYASIRNNYGNVSLWETERLKSEGLVQNPELLRSLFQTANSWAGGNQDLAKLILYKDLLSQYGLNPQDIDILYKTYQTTGFSKYFVDGEAATFKTGYDILAEGASHTPVELIDAATKELKDLNEGLSALSNYSVAIEHAGTMMKEAAESIITAMQNNIESHLGMYLVDLASYPYNYSRP